MFQQQKLDKATMDACSLGVLQAFRACGATSALRPRTSIYELCRLRHNVTYRHELTDAEVETVRVICAGFCSVLVPSGWASIFAFSRPQITERSSLQWTPRLLVTQVRSFASSL